MPNNTSRYCFIFLILLITAGCGRTAQPPAEKAINCPVAYAYNASFQVTWDASLMALSKYGSIDIQDQITRKRTTKVAQFEGSLLQHLDYDVHGLIFDYNFEIEYVIEGAATTRIQTHVRLNPDQFARLWYPEWHMAQVENFLRERFYRDLCTVIFPDGKGHCSRGIHNETSAQPEEKPTVIKPPRAPRPAPVFDEKLQAAQKALRQAGYDPGPADGFIGTRTTEALKKYQLDQGITVTGKLNKATSSRLFPSPDTQPPASQPPVLSEEPKLGAPPQKVEENRQPENIPKKDTPAKITGQNEAVKDPPQTISVTPEQSVPPEKKSSQGKMYTTKSTYLLKEPDLYGSDSLASLAKGASVQVLSREGTFFKVHFNGKQGYVTGDALSTETP